MKTATISQIQDLANGSVIGEMTVTVKKVFPPKNGNSPKTGKPWTATAAILEDHTGEARATFWDIPVQDLQGQRIKIQSQSGKKGLAGLSTKYSDYSKANELSVTTAAAVIDAATDKLASMQAATVRSHNVVDRTTARKKIFANAKLYVECHKAVTWISSQIDQMSEAHFQAAVASMFISAEKAGLSASFADETAPEPEKKSEPKEEKKPQVELEDDDIKW